MGAGRAPHGARGLKYGRTCAGRYAGPGRTPHGARGLKSVWKCLWNAGAMSRPAWGAWIEIIMYVWQWQFGNVAPRMGRVD